MKKNIAKTIVVNKPKLVEERDDLGNICSKLVETVVSCTVKQIDEFVLRKLYEAYGNSDVSRIFVIDETEFNEFLKEMLPLWLERKE